MDILIGCGQITWIRFTADGPQWLASEEQVLAEIAQAGYDGAPAGPDRDRSAQETSELYASYGLRPAPGYYGTAFWNKERRNEILEKAQLIVETDVTQKPTTLDSVTVSRTYLRSLAL